MPNCPVFGNMTLLQEMCDMYAEYSKPPPAGYVLTYMILIKIPMPEMTIIVSASKS